MSQNGDLILKVLLNILPFYINEAEDLFTKLSQPSKAYLFKKEPLLVLSNKNFQYYNLYLEPNKIYEEFNEYCSTLFNNEFPDGFEPDVFQKKHPDLIVPTSFDDLNNYYDNIADELMLEINSPKAFDDDFKYIINATLARFFDALSIIDNKKSISDLLAETLYQDKYLNIPKAVSTDPNVLKIPEINEFILKQNLNVQSSIIHKNSLALDKSFISNKKNKISQLPLFYISLVDSFGLIDGSFPLPYKVHKYIADQVGALKHLDDIDYFLRLFNNFKKSKKSRNKPKKV